MEVNNDHVITRDICNKFIEIKFFVGCMVSQSNRLLQRLTAMSLINKIFLPDRKLVNSISVHCVACAIAVLGAILLLFFQSLLAAYPIRG